ncbi:hypothetical protein TSAR_006396 [Trichomalopsis sarcophagae]|uniref:Uncharacterized protein n=1 Tax=Trichomalopsis sarcophagae TaxID=543379 RepID=A0A232ED77_9HYME|nr:hypothetical protein TSAR_006396 [Trichomalopsis sarcophagae]
MNARRKDGHLADVRGSWWRKNELYSTCMIVKLRTQREGDQSPMAPKTKSGPTFQAKIAMNARRKDGHLADVRGSWWRKNELYSTCMIVKLRTQVQTYHGEFFFTKNKSLIKKMMN